MKKLLFLLLIIITTSCKYEKKASERPFRQLSKLIDNYADNTLKRGNINSIALAIYKDGDVYLNYYGELDKEKGNKPNDNTLYEIASITKTFTGTLTAKAVLDGKLNLEDDIRKYLDGDFKNLEFEGTPISIKNLLTHTLGFKDKHPKQFAAINDSIRKGYYINREIDYDFDDFLNEIKKVELNKKPGTFFEYNNVGSELMAYILQKIYKKDFKEIVYAFLNDLGMNNTYLMEFEKHEKYLANGYDEQKKLAPFYKNPLLGGAGGAISTLPDLIKLMKFQLESNNPIVKEATRVLFKDSETQMGYLWQDLGVAKEEGFYYSKTGNSIGIHSGILICPDSNYGEILIINNNDHIASNDFFSLMYKVETDLIKFPKINLKSYIKPKLLIDKNSAKEEFYQLKKDSINYFNSDLPYALNTIGYEFLNEHQPKKAIQIFEFAISEFPENKNFYDSLGESYFRDNQYQKAKNSYQKSLALNLANEKPNQFLIKNAKKYLSKIDSLIER